MEKTRLYSVEYMDDEGDTIVSHSLMTPQEALNLLEKMRMKGVSCTICDLSGVGTGTPDVPSLDARQMGQAGRGLIK